MGRPVLDPNSLAGAVGQIEVERLPRQVRAFKFYPDISLLQAGDLVLVTPVAKTRNAIVIERVQAGQHAPFDAQWIHAATYLGDNSIVEIDGAGVAVNELHKYVPTHRR